MNKFSKIYVAGHRGLVGSAIVRALKKEGYGNIITKTRDEVDLLDPVAVKSFSVKRDLIMFLSARKSRWYSCQL